MVLGTKAEGKAGREALPDWAEQVFPPPLGTNTEKGWALGRSLAGPGAARPGQPKLEIAYGLYPLSPLPLQPRYTKPGKGTEPTKKKRYWTVTPCQESSCRSSCRSVASAPARPGSVGEAARSLRHSSCEWRRGNHGNLHKGLKAEEKRLEAMVKRQRGTSSDIAAVLLTLTMCISIVSQTETSGACTRQSSLETSGTRVLRSLQVLPSDFFSSLQRAEP